MNYDVIRAGFKIQAKYWEDQWLIGELEDRHGNFLSEFYKTNAHNARLEVGLRQIAKQSPPGAEAYIATQTLRPPCPHCNGDRFQPHTNCILRSA